MPSTVRGVILVQGNPAGAYRCSEVDRLRRLNEVHTRFYSTMTKDGDSLWITVAVTDSN